MREYFCRVLPFRLLYSFEMQQYDGIVEQMVSNRQSDLSEIYGAEHLLRFLVKLPDLLIQEDSEKKHVEDLKTEIVSLISFLLKNSSSYFGTKDDYTIASEEYMRIEQLRDE